MSVHAPPLHIRHQVLKASRPYLLAFHPLVKARTQVPHQPGSMAAQY
ncbi:hypothetical protein ACFXPY_44180 [Streptomyces sp. NPDC059153]